ncbi:MAG: bifunctional precorrin-2 dehydrogenase/sirohydrochlorin ferrochelatase [Syntrophomonadaceae bacterium]|nr:bifunctional precorrin-2 dehydrogenase/sirohydrochlorin ferrochelatase [Syntrophomonadaceae bacterium]
MARMFPIVVKLEGCSCLVVGGGTVAVRKVRNLLQCGAAINVVSPSFCEEMVLLGQEEQVTLIPRKFEDRDVQGHMMVFAATSDEAVNQRVYEVCRENGILVNTVDDPDKCNFLVPATMRRGALTIAINTEGKSPLLARRLRMEMEDRYGPEYADYLELLGDARAVVKSTFDRESTRKEVFARLLELPILSLLQQGKKEEAKERIMECIYSWPD